MTSPDTDEQADELDGAERAYQWTIRGLYVVLLVGNAYILYDQFKDSPDALVLRHKVRTWWAQVRNCEGCAKRKAAIRSMVNHTLFEAEQIVDEARAWTEGQPNGD